MERQVEEAREGESEESKPRKNREEAGTRAQRGFPGDSAGVGIDSSANNSFIQSIILFLWAHLLILGALWYKTNIEQNRKIFPGEAYIL